MLEVGLQSRRDSFELNVEFAVPTPGITALFGRSGSGKSTLVNAIAGLLRPQRGRIALDGYVLFDHERGIDVRVERRGIGYVFQNARLFPHMSVLRNLRYGLVRVRSGETRIAADSVIELLGLRSLLERRPSQLSGGEQQRVALGRALLAQPRLLLLDEPLASIDLARREEVLPYLEKLRDALRIPMVYVSHQFDEILRLADHVVLLDQGKATAQGTMTALSLRPELRGIVGPEAVGAVIDAQVSSLDAANGLARIAVGHGALQVEATHLTVGQRVRLQLLARDLILATEMPRGLSVRNVLPAVVRGTNADESGSVLVHLQTGDVPLLARITNLAAQELGLRAGMQVWVLVKSVTLRGHVFAGPLTA